MNAKSLMNKISEIDKKILQLSKFNKDIKVIRFIDRSEDNRYHVQIEHRIVLNKLKQTSKDFWIEKEALSLENSITTFIENLK